MHRRPSHTIAILVLGCLLGACGFQLRGVGDNTTVVPENWKSMHLATSNPNSELSREVSIRFAASGVNWTDRGNANFSLALGPERFEQRNLSLNSEARAAEFELTMSTEFSVVNSDKTEVMPPTRVAVIKQMENDPRNVVGKAEEVRLLKAEMRTELAQKLMRRVGFYAASTQQAASP